MSTFTYYAHYIIRYKNIFYESLRGCKNDCFHYLSESYDEEAVYVQEESV